MAATTASLNSAGTAAEASAVVAKIARTAFCLGTTQAGTFKIVSAVLDV